MYTPRTLSPLYTLDPKPGLKFQRAVWRGQALQGHLAHKKQLPLGTYSSICLGPYGGPGGEAVSYERVTPVEETRHDVSRVLEQI